MNRVDRHTRMCDYIIMTNTKYTFDENTLSDLHKDARGHRPHGEYFWAHWNESDNDGKQAIWDVLSNELELTIAEEAAQEAAALVEFKALVQATIGLGAHDEETALRWLTNDESFGRKWDVEHWVWGHGILFTDYGVELVKRLNGMVTYKPDVEI